MGIEGGQQLFGFNNAVNFGDVGAGELDNSREAIAGFVRREKDICAGCGGFAKSTGEVVNFIACEFVAKRVGEMAVGDKDLHVAE